MRLRNNLIVGRFVSLVVLVPMIGGLTACTNVAANAADKKRETAATAPVTKDPVAQTTATARDTAQIKTVDEAYTMMREVRAARLAVFDGSTDAAKRLVSAAKTNFDAASISQNYASRRPKNARADENFIPFDATTSLSERFTPTPENKAKLDEANGHIARGDFRLAKETLRLANIEVVTSVAMLPVAPTLTRLNEATALMTQGKYYEANIALKGIEDSVILDSYGVDETPVQPARK